MVRYLRAANVKDGSLDLSDVKEMDFNPAEQVTYALRPGDVLVTEGAGSLAAVGASAVWDGELDGIVCFQNTLLRLRAKGRHRCSVPYVVGAPCLRFRPVRGHRRRGEHLSPRG